MTENRYNDMLNRTRESVDYWAESAITDFTEEIVDLMNEENITRADLARNIGTSQAYITKVLRGKANFTIETMTKLARAFGRVVRVHLAPEDVIVEWKETTDSESNILMEDYIQFQAQLDVHTGSKDNEYEPNLQNTWMRDDNAEAAA